eukprot:scaffold104174_cov16-Tisochrysis_lutea.AAC.1
MEPLHNCTSRHPRNALADAFGVEDPDHHVSHFDRHRQVQYSPALLLVGAGRDALSFRLESSQWLPSHELCSTATGIPVMERRNPCLLHLCPSSKEPMAVPASRLDVP